MVYQIDDTTAVASQPALPTDSIGAPGFFTGGSTSGGAPTRVRYWWLNMVQQELLNIALAAGLTANKTDNTQCITAIQTLIAKAFGGATFTPVQQGGGPNQTTAKICIGADSTGIGGIRYALMNGTTLTDQGFILRSYAPNPAVGDTAFTNIYYAGGQGRVWAAISASIFGALAWYSDVQTTNTNLTNEVTRATNAEATLTSQVNTKLTTTAPSAAAGDLPLANFYYSGTYTRPWAAISANVFGALAWYADVTTVQGNLTTALTNQANTNANLSTQIGTKITGTAGTGYTGVTSLVVRASDQSLALNLANGTIAQTYAQVVTGVINDAPYYGWWKKTRLPDGTWLLEQWVTNAGMKGEDMFVFPLPFAGTPIIQITSSTDNGTTGVVKETFANYVRGTLTATQFQLSIWELDTSQVGNAQIVASSDDFNIHVYASGVVSS